MKPYLFEEENFLEQLGRLMRIDATLGNCGPVTEEAPLGQGVRDSIACLLELGESWGMRTKMLDGLCGWIEAGEGDRMVAILGHVDTVPVEQEGWKAPPHDATVLDGWVYGRGVIDDKGPTLLALYAIKSLAEAGHLDKRVRLIIGGDEESGVWRCMDRYRQTEELPDCAFSPDGAYPATYAEKGILHLHFSRPFDSGCRPIQVEAGGAYNVVPAYARAVIDGAVYEAEGKAAHAAQPDLGLNALEELGSLLTDEEVEHPFLNLLTDLFSEDNPYLKLADEPSGPLTNNPAIVEVTPQSITLKCDVRVPVTVAKEQVMELAGQLAAPHGFAATADSFMEPLYVAKDSPLVTTLQDVYHKHTGRKDPPAAIGGGTYARAFQNAVAFGAAFPGEEDTTHQTNERWALDSIRANYQILCDAIRRI